MRALSFATLFSALSGFIVIYLATWALGVEDAAQFQAYWGLFFAATGALDGLLQETTRGVSAAKKSTHPGTGSPWRIGVRVSVVTAVVFALTGMAWIGLLISGDTATKGGALGLIVVGLASYTFQAILTGVLSGLGLWSRFAWLLTLDAGVRLVLALLSWWLGWGMFAFFLVTVAGAVSWIVLLALDKKVREKVKQGSIIDVTDRQFTRRALSAMLAAGSSAMLITGYPVFVTATNPPENSGEVTVAGIVLAVTLTRAPILVPLTRFQSALIVRFVEAKDTLIRSMTMPVALTLSLGFIGGVLAWLIGPWILENFFADGFVVPGMTLGVLTFASAVTGALMISGTATLAVQQHQWFVAGWITASAVAFGVLSLPLSLSVGVCLSLIIGPLCGIALHVVGLRLRKRTAGLPSAALPL